MPLFGRMPQYGVFGGPAGSPMNRPMLDIDPMTGLPRQPQQPQPPIRPPAPPQPPGSEMPWGTNGQAFDDMYAKRPAPAAPQGTQSRPGVADAYAPVAPMAPQPQIQQTPLPPVEKQPQPGDTLKQDQSTDKQAQPQEIFGFRGMDLLKIGLTMLGESQNGGNWGNVATALGDVQQQKMAEEDRAREIERQKKQDARQEIVNQQQDEMFGLSKEEALASKEERARIIAERARLGGARVKAIEATNDPALKAVLSGMTDENYGAFLGQSYLSKQEADAQAKAAADQRAFIAGENAKDRKTQLQVADFRRTDPTATVRGRADMQRLAPWQDAAMTAQTYTLPRIQRMKELITDLAKVNGVFQPFDANFRINAARMLQDHPETAGMLQELEGLTAQFTREEMEKLKPASNMDYDSTKKNLPGADWEIGASMRTLDRMEKELGRGIERTNDMIGWMDEGYSLSDKNKDGKTFLQAYGYDPAAAVTSAPEPAKETQYPEPPQNAVILLQQNANDPNYRASFEKHFGRAALEKYLGKSTVGGLPTGSGKPFGAGYMPVRGGN